MRALDVLLPGAAIVAALALFGIFVALAGARPVQAWVVLFQGAFGDWFSWQNTLQRAAPLMLTALCVALPARAGLTIIGGEGALVLGGLAGATLAHGLPLGGLAGTAAVCLAGAVLGAAWIALAGWLRQWRGVNETISSLLLAYVALGLFKHLVEGPLRDPENLNKPATFALEESLRIGGIAGSDVHWGLVLGVLACLAAAAWLRWTPSGFSVRVVGGNLRAARLVGLPASRLVLLACALGGVAAGPARACPAAGLATAADAQVALSVQDLQVMGNRGTPAVRGLSLQVRSGEILGVAGVSGNGQRELVEALVGQRERAGGSVEVLGTAYAARRSENHRLKVRSLPEEPLRNACVGDLSVAENMALRDFDLPPLAAGGRLRFDRWRARARDWIASYGIRTQGEDAPIRSLSGGNVQRAVLARELDGDINVLIAANPVFGLDFAAVQEIHARIRGGRAAGGAVLLVSEDLDELLELADRIAVMSEGRIVHETAAATAERHVLGAHMGGAHPVASPAVAAAARPSPGGAASAGQTGRPVEAACAD